MGATTRLRGVARRAQACSWRVRRCMLSLRVCASCVACFSGFGELTGFWGHRDPGRRCRCHPGWFEYRREVPRGHSVRARSQHDGVYERYLVRHERQHCAQVRRSSPSVIGMLLTSSISVQYGDWFCVRAPGLSAPNPGYGRVLCLVRSRKDGFCRRDLHVSSCSI